MQPSSAFGPNRIPTASDGFTKRPPENRTASSTPSVSQIEGEGDRNSPKKQLQVLAQIEKRRPREKSNWKIETEPSLTSDHVSKGH
jgi:hypothetical protein